MLGKFHHKMGTELRPLFLNDSFRTKVCPTLDRRFQSVRFEIYLVGRKRVLYTKKRDKYLLSLSNIQTKYITQIFTFDV